MFNRTSGGSPLARTRRASGRSSNEVANAQRSVIVKSLFFDVVYDIHATAPWQYPTGNSIEVVAMTKSTKTVTNVANHCNRSAEWVRYHADRGNIPFVQAKIGSRSVRLFNSHSLRVAKKLAGAAQ